ncbi:orexin receptor type 2-like [Amphiura filiformis]|uniref:orexin receptor type 2-like n=1 Tax=Amphiura filiformis TaxID=82378 RepID=UPI003B228846
MPIVEFIMEPNMTQDINSTFGDYYDYLDYIYQQTKERVYPQSYEWPLIVAYGIIFLLALLGNTLVCVAVLRNEHMRTVTNYYIVNLAVADILVSIICLPATVTLDVSESWFFGDRLCTFIPYFQNVSVAVSVYTLMMIAVDRYLAICRPLKFQTSATRTISVIIIVWTVSFVIMIPDAIVHDTQANKATAILGKPLWLMACYEAKWYGKEWQKLFYVFKSTVLYGMPLLVISVAYIMVCIRLWSGIPTEEGSSTSTCRSDQKAISKTTAAQLQSRRNVARMLIVVVIIFAVCFFPLHLLNLLRVFDAFKGIDAMVDSHQIAVPYLIAHLMAFINSAVNPVIYNFMSAKFRQAFLSVFGCSSISGRTPPGHPNTRGYNRSIGHSTTAYSESRSHGTEYVPLSHMGNKTNSNSAVQNTYVMS